MQRETPYDPVDAILRSVNESLMGVVGTPPANLRPGQVWRARWDDVFALVFVDAIVDGSRNMVRVAPVSVGSDDADDTAVILPQDSNPLSVALSVWPNLVTEIAEVVLERWVTGVDMFESLASITAAAELGQLRRGLPILNEMSPRHRERMLLELAMDVLSLAADLPAGSGKLDVILAGAAASSIASVLDVKPYVALQILRGDVFIDRAQAERLGQAFSRDPQELLDANPAAPDDLVSTMTALHRSASIRALAQKQQVSESLAFAHAVQGTFALAARGEGKSRDWASRVDRFFELALS